MKQTSLVVVSTGADQKNMTSNKYAPPPPELRIRGADQHSKGEVERKNFTTSFRSIEHPRTASTTGHQQQTLPRVKSSKMKDRKSYTQRWSKAQYSKAMSCEKIYYQKRFTLIERNIWQNQVPTGIWKSNLNKYHRHLLLDSAPNLGLLISH